MSTLIQNANIPLNFITMSTLIAQSLQIYKLQEDNLLDSPKLRYLYKMFFRVLTASSIGMIAFNWNFKSSAGYTYLFLIPIIVISSFYTYRSFFISTSDQGILNSNLETTQLTVTSESTTPMNNINSGVISIIPTDMYKAHASRDISPISSLSKQQTQVNSYGSLGRGTNPGYNKAKTPILATLLHAESVFALDSITKPSHQTTPSPLNIALASFIMLMIVSTQLIYSFSIIKTSVYTPPKRQFTIFGLNLFISLSILLSNLYNYPLVTIFTFADHSNLFNSVIPIIVAIQTLISLSLLISIQVKGENNFAFRSISIYESVSRRSSSIV